MDHNLSALERAFQLAKSGRAAFVSDIIATLKREGYEISQIQGLKLIAQLKKLIEESRTSKP